MGRDREIWGGDSERWGAIENRCEEIARDRDGLGEVWRYRERWGGTARCVEGHGRLRRGVEGQGEVGRTRERWGGPGSGGEGQGEAGRDREL